MIIELMFSVPISYTNVFAIPKVYPNFERRSQRSESSLQNILLSNLYFLITSEINKCGVPITERGPGKNLAFLCKFITYDKYEL